MILVLPCVAFSIQTLKDDPESMFIIVAMILGIPTIIVGLFLGSTILTVRLRGCLAVPGGCGMSSSEIVVLVDVVI